MRQINATLEVLLDRPFRLAPEVQKHLDWESVRCVAIQESAGMNFVTRVKDAVQTAMEMGVTAILRQLREIFGRALAVTMVLPLTCALIVHAAPDRRTWRGSGFPPADGST